MGTTGKIPTTMRGRAVNRIWARRAMALGAVVALGITTAACGSSTSSTSTTSKSTSTNTLTISDEYGETWTCQFNPYNSTDVGFSFGPVYEELVYQDLLKSGAPTPWLATK